MAHHKSALKRIRQNHKRRERNRYYAKTMRNAIRRIREMENKEEALKELPAVTSMIDRLAKRNVIHKNKANNLKSSLNKRVNSL